MRKKGFGIVKKKNKQPVKFVLKNGINKRGEFWGFWESYFPSFPIQDKEIKEYFLNLKKELLKILDKANATNEVQELKFDNAIYRIWPGGDEKILKQFKYVQW